MAHFRIAKPLRPHKNLKSTNLGPINIGGDRGTSDIRFLVGYSNNSMRPYTIFFSKVACYDFIKINDKLISNVAQFHFLIRQD